LEVLVQNFDELIHIVEKLLSPEGCQWDREQTFSSLRPYLIEEVYEIIEAIDLDDNSKIIEEVGDVFFHLVFICKLAERDKRFVLTDTLHSITEKLIRRHPHVFGSVKLESVDEVVAQWESIKKLEKGKDSRKSLLDDIPKDLPLLAKTQKMLAKFAKLDFVEALSKKVEHLPDFKNENELGEVLYALVKKADEQGLNATHALLKKLTELEKEFRQIESKT